MNLIRFDKFDAGNVWVEPQLGFCCGFSQKGPIPFAPVVGTQLVPCSCVEDNSGMWPCSLSVLCKISLPAGAAEGYWSWLQTLVVSTHNINVQNEKTVNLMLCFSNESLSLMALMELFLSQELNPKQWLMNHTLCPTYRLAWLTSDFSSGMIWGVYQFFFSYVVFNYYWLWDKDRDEGCPAKHLILFRSVLLKSHLIQ